MFRKLGLDANSVAAFLLANIGIGVYKYIFIW